MGSKFTALPVKDGESFVLETVHAGRAWVILVDAGKKSSPKPDRNRLLRALRDHCKTVGSRIDIAICTHKDHDHAGGFPDFVRAWTADGGTIGEFWLPGGWSAALPQALTDSDGLVSALATGASMAARALLQEAEGTADPSSRNFVSGEPRRFVSLDERLLSLRDVASGPDNGFEEGSRLRSSAGFHADAAVPPVGEAWSDEAIATPLGLHPGDVELVGSLVSGSGEPSAPFLDRIPASPEYVPWFAASPRDISYFHRHAHLTNLLTRSALETADIIGTIAKVAVEHRVRVRWFDFEPFEQGAAPAGGYPGFLQPLNTVERTQPRSESALSLFFSLRLTEQNVASLVFQKLETPDEPGVLFLADSRLAFGIDEPKEDFPPHLAPLDRPFVFTAPHHGSRNNDNAYKVLNEWLEPSLVQESYAIRNGGVWNQTLADFLDHERRRCAHCYQCHRGEWEQAVSVMTGRSPDWDFGTINASACGTPSVRSAPGPKERRRSTRMKE